MLLIFCDLPRRKLHTLLKKKEKKARLAVFSARNSSLPIPTSNHNQPLHYDKAHSTADKLQIL